MKLRVDVCDTPEGFLALADEWEALLDRSTSGSLFLSWAWLHAWWKQFRDGYELLILAARDGDGRLVGIAPLCVVRTNSANRLPTVRFLGTEKVSSDYLDVIVEPGQEERVAAALWHGLRRCSDRWAVLHLGDLLDDSITLRRWLPLAVAERFTWDRIPSQHCPYLALPADGEAFRKSLGPAMRQNFRKKTKRLEEVGVAFHSVAAAEDLPRALERLYDLHRMRWRTRDLPGNFEDPRVLAFHADLVARLAPRGAMRLHELRVGERTIASLYEFEYKGVAFCYQTGFDPSPPDDRVPATKYSPGVVLIGRSMEAAIARGAGEFDFLRGPERYKAEWTRARRRTDLLVMAAPENLPARLSLLLDRAVRGLKGVAKRLLRRPDPAAALDIP
jgi:CelD/BcsL family acetyltransferase involved in cellulose biosynthesis